MAVKPFESKIQDLVYNVDVGFGLRLIKTALYLLFVLAILLLYTVTQFKGFKEAAAMEQAQLARNLAQTGHLTTQCIRPASLWYLKEHSGTENPSIEQHPDILHPPLYPVVLSGWFRLWRPSFAPEFKGQQFPPEKHIIALGNLFALLTGLLVYGLGRRLFERRVALLGVTIYFLSDLVWRDGISGLSLSMLTFLATAMFYLASVVVTNREEGKEPLRWFVPFLLSVLACAAAFLTRYGAIVLLPALLLWYGTGFKEKRGRWVLATAGIFLVAVLPWLIRNAVVSGGLLGLAPYMALMDTPTFSADLFERSLAPVLTAEQVVSSLQIKWLENLAGFYNEGLISLGDGLLIALFLTTFFYQFVRPQVHRLRWCVALSAVLLLALAALYGEMTFRLLDIFWPFVILYGTAFFYLLLDRLQLKARIFDLAVVTLLVFLSALPLILTLLPPRADIPYPPYVPRLIAQVSGMLEEDELLCTDMPWATAWYGNRDSLQLPATVDEFYEVHDINKQISGLYFTTLTRNQPYIRTLKMGHYRTWFPILEGRIPSDFPLTVGFPMYNLDQVFLTDRPRWKE